MTKKEFYTTGDVSQIVNISRATVSRKFDEGIFSGKKNPITGERLISHASLEKFMSQYGLSLDSLKKPVTSRRKRQKSRHADEPAVPVEPVQTAKRAILVGSIDGHIKGVVEQTFADDERIDVSYATTGYEALILGSKNVPDLLILDEDLPGIACPEAVKSLQKADDQGKMKTLCLLATFRPEKVIDIGADEYLAKDALDELTPTRRSALFGYMFGKITGDTVSLEKYEGEYLKASKPESLGILTSRIANDFNNMLTSIFGNIALAKTMIADKDKNEVFDILTEAESASQLAMKLTNYLFAYKTGVPKKLRVSVNALVEDVMQFSLRGSDTLCEINIADGLPEVPLDREQISQALNNIILNADQSMGGNGTIHIDIDTVTVEPDAGLSLRRGDYVRISVSDSGVGIPAEYLPKIFDPYFSTRPRGSGLGLPTANSIVKNHGGHIAVDSTVGEGTTFHVYLPLESAEANENATLDTPAKASMSGRILVVDDEPTVRKVLARMIEHLGHRYEVVSDGEEAIRTYQQALEENDTFDVIIMDLTMPGGISGRESVEKILAVDPKARAIASSGNTDDTAFNDYRSYGFKGAIPKPYELKQLEEALNRIMGE